MSDLPEPEQVDRMERDELVALWRRLFREPAPATLSLTFLRRFVAFELQARRHGGLPLASRRRLESLTSGAARPRAAAPAAGGRLLREWNGTTHVVDVTDSGYRWDGREFGSLSAVAREITGARWSGPRFFGLDRNRASR